MSDTPIKISRYIQLTVKEPLDKAQKTAWMVAVRRHAPSGTLATVQTTDDQGSLRSVCMVHKEGKKTNAYLIPLTRDLAPDEVQKIVDAFADKTELQAFDIETNETMVSPAERSSINLDDERHIAICTAMAKARHEKWLRDRLNSGWRFGTKFDADEKVHPLLRPWEQLPDQFRTPDMESPQALLDLIQANGFAIVPKDDLENLLNKAKH
jgi:post-segregation antitoxin (ccd killing protein)